jgi:PmbA protein
VKLLDSLVGVVREARDLPVDMFAYSSVTGTTRFANSEVHQNTMEAERSVTVRVARGKSVGVSTTNAVDPASLRRAVEDAAEIARVIPENPEFAGLPVPRRVRSMTLSHPTTAKLTPAARVSTVDKVFRAAEREGFSVAGAYRSTDGEIAIASSTGVAASQTFTTVAANVVVMGESDGASGYAGAASRDATTVDVPALGGIATNKCRWSKDPREIPPGEYDVLLEPHAFSDVLRWLGWIGMSSRSYEDGTSFFCDRIGKRVAHESLSIYDDPLDAAGMPFPFDFEGMPKSRTPLIEAGVARGVVHSSHSAAKAGVSNTGNAVPGDTGSQGGFPMHLSVRPGRIPVSRMLDRLGTGLLITRFHYVNGLIDTRNAVLTGMTRDGTYWVEGGEVKYPVKNLRFTQPMLEAFSRVDGISRERFTPGVRVGDIGTIIAPSVVVRRFSFTGASDH